MFLSSLQAMELIKELMEQKDVLKEKMEELHQQQEVKLFRHIFSKKTKSLVCVLL